MLKQLYEASKIEYQDTVESYLYDNIDKLLDLLSFDKYDKVGHTEIHDSDTKDDKKILENILIGDKLADSIFNLDVNEIICNALVYELDNIHKWFAQSQIVGSGRRLESFQEKLELTVNMREPIGYGFLKYENNNSLKIKKFETDIVRVVLKRSHDLYSNTGFTIKTAFPMITNIMGRKDITDDKELIDLLKQGIYNKMSTKSQQKLDIQGKEELEAAKQNKKQNIAR